MQPIEFQGIETKYYMAFLRRVAFAAECSAADRISILTSLFAK